MVIKNFIDKLRSKGYDDLYLADLAHKWDGALMLVFFFVFNHSFRLGQVSCLEKFGTHYSFLDLGGE